MKRSNTAIEEFIANYAEADPHRSNVMDDFYDYSDEDFLIDDSAIDITPFGNPSTLTNTNTTTTSTTNNTVPITGANSKKSAPFQPILKKSRYQLLCDEPDAPFARAIAGAMNIMNFEDVYIHEDVDRMIEIDYENQRNEKQRHARLESIKKDITLAEVRVENLKKQLVSQADIISMNEAYANIEILKDIVSNERYNYVDLARELDEIQFVSNGIATDEELISYIEEFEQKYRERKDANTNRFRDEFKVFKETNPDYKNALLFIAQKAFIEKKAKIAENPVYKEDSSRHQLTIEFVEGFVEDLSDGEQEFLAEGFGIKTEPRKNFEPADSDIDALMCQKGMTMTSPLQNERISPLHNGYASFMTALFNARDDAMARNEIVKGVDLFSIHEPALNERIKSLQSPSIISIIDTSKKYFKETFLNNGSLIELYETARQSVEYGEETIRYIETYTGILAKTRDQYQKEILSSMKIILTAITLDGSSDSSQRLFNLKKLDLYRDRILSGTVQYNEIVSSIIADTSFMIYYKKKVPDPALYDKKLSSYLSLCQLFIAYASYIPEHDEKISESIATAVELVETLRNEEILIIKENSALTSRNDSRGTSLSVQLRPDIEDKINEAYRMLQQYCPNLRGLPLSAIKSKYSIDMGLGRDFARYVASLYAQNTLTFKDNYKSTNDYNNAVKRCSETLIRLKAYTYSKTGNSRDSYKISFNFI